MRNIFDQYQQPENKLTHAFITMLSCEKKLIKPFLRWLKVEDIPPLKSFGIGQQSFPGEVAADEEKTDESLPDAYICDEEDWIVIFESKVQSGVSINQLNRHLAKAERRGFDKSTLILITVDRCSKKMPENVVNILWKDVYRWMSSPKYRDSFWVQKFLDYMQIFETKMLANNYEVRGTITMFTGFHFDKDNPYTYREGKRLIKLLRHEFLNNKTLVKELGIDCECQGRCAITKGRYESVWDYISQKKYSTLNFTSSPHVSFGLRQELVTVSITVPNGLKGGIKKRVKEGGIEGFRNAIENVCKNLKELTDLDEGIQPIISLEQRHYKSQRSNSVNDGIIDVDLRAIIGDADSSVKYQPMWLEAIYNILCNKETNIQLSMQVRFPYSCECMQNPQSADLLAKTLIKLKPFPDYIDA